MRIITIGKNVKYFSIFSPSKGPTIPFSHWNTLNLSDSKGCNPPISLHLVVNKRSSSAVKKVYITILFLLYQPFLVI